MAISPYRSSWREISWSRTPNTTQSRTTQHLHKNTMCFHSIMMPCGLCLLLYVCCRIDTSSLEMLCWMVYCCNKIKMFGSTDTLHVAWTQRVFCMSPLYRGQRGSASSAWAHQMVQLRSPRQCMQTGAEPAAALPAWMTGNLQGGDMKQF